ncbi:MAG: UDP-glucose 4-epimerase GalE, partial [Myxococcota bacterium]
MVMRIVVTGGAGYIGSHAVFALAEAGHEVVVVDNLARGHRAAVDRRAELAVVDLRDTPRIARRLEGAHAVWHFAASSIVSESVREPLVYWDDNVVASLSLLRAMQIAGVNRLVFSSTAATYGIPDVLPITESTPQRPINPYGRTKLAIEQAIQDVQAADPAFASAILRYFNVVGCAHGLGEDHVPETHIVPILLEVAAGVRDGFAIFGDDYPTPDGTCVRDYVHVEDLVDAHRLALAALRPGDQRVYNVGLGTGWSVRELVSATQLVTGRTFPVRVEPRRAGDPPALVTDPARIRRELHWEPRHRDVASAIAGQWAWMQQFPEGW